MPQDAARIASRDRELIRMNNAINESLQTIPPGQAGVFAAPYELKEWYSALKPGDYQLTVRSRAQGQDFPLVSNMIRITIDTGPG